MNVPGFDGQVMFSCFYKEVMFGDNSSIRKQIAKMLNCEDHGKLGNRADQKNEDHITSEQDI